MNRCYQWKAHISLEDVVTVVDQDPTHSPARDEVALGHATTAEDGDAGGEGSEEMELVAFEHLQHN